MLGMESKLMFPRLVFISDGTLVTESTRIVREGVESGSTSGKATHLYRLDWRDIDKEKEVAHDEWARTQHSELHLPFIGTLPEPYDSTVKDLIFALDRAHLQEIQRNCRRGLEEWALKRPFDTCIREMCLETANAHVMVAFSLLADCMYDAKKQYFCRGFLKQLYRTAMLYKFWSHQTGRGLLRIKSGLDELVERHTKDPIQELTEFEAAIGLFEKSVEASFASVYKKNPPAVGIALEPGRRVDPMPYYFEVLGIPCSSDAPEEDVFSVHQKTMSERGNFKAFIEARNALDKQRHKTVRFEVRDGFVTAFPASKYSCTLHPIPLPDAIYREEGEKNLKPVMMSEPMAPASS